MLKLNILLIASAGGALLIMALLMLVFFDRLEGGMRYLLPIPPLTVAVYVYLVNYVKDQSTEGFQFWALVQDAAFASAFSASVFFAVAIAMAGVISVFSSS